MIKFIIKGCMGNKIPMICFNCWFRSQSKECIEHTSKNNKALFLEGVK